MQALVFLSETLISLGLLAGLLRLLLQWARADFRNPLARSLVQITNPLLIPLRRLLPAIGRIDTASVLAVVVLALLKVSVAWLLSGLVENTLEMLDAGGAPRLRVAPPFLVGADGARTDAMLAIAGCAVDKSAAAPWGRRAGSTRGSPAPQPS